MKLQFIGTEKTPDGLWHKALTGTGYWNGLFSTQLCFCIIAIMLIKLCSYCRIFASKILLKLISYYLSITTPNSTMTKLNGEL